MRTTIDLPDELFRQAKARAALQGISIKLFITAVLEEAIAEGKAQRANKRIKLPLVPSKKPGSRQITEKTVAELLGEEDLSVLT